jgi:hypothetical protein
MSKEKSYRWTPADECFDLDKTTIREGDTVKESEIAKETLKRLLAKGKLIPTDGSVTVKVELTDESKATISALEIQLKEALEINESLKSELSEKLVELEGVNADLETANQKIADLLENTVAPESQAKTTDKPKKMGYE